VYPFVFTALIKGVQPALKRPVASPFETIERLMFMALVIYVGFVLGIFFLKRGLAWLDDRFWITYTGHVPTYGTLGNAFMELQAIAQPEKQYVIEMKEDEKQKKEENDVAGLAGPPARRRCAACGKIDVPAQIVDEAALCPEHAYQGAD